MKKVGIMTMHRPINVGCYLQAYATQEAVIKLGYDCEIIDYNYPNKHHQQSSFKNKIARAINKQLKRLLGRGEFGLSEQRFRNFYTQLYKLSEKQYDTKEELHSDPPDYDLYCIGSDQVWNPSYILGDTSFFCEFAPEGKPIISYASSFGVTKIPDTDLDLYKRCLGRFSKIGVREDTGVKLAEELTGKSAQFVVDPTQLFGADEWLEKIPASNYDDEPYILCYGTPYPNTYVEEVALHIQQKTNYKIIHLFGLPWQRFDKRIKHVFSPGPLEFLGWIKNAAIVVTTSFHGTIFSANFGVPFYSVYRDGESGSRQLNILNKLNVPHRGLLWESPMPGEPFFDLDFETIQSKQEAMRAQSWEYLKEALSACD